MSLSVLLRRLLQAGLLLSAAALTVWLDGRGLPSYALAGVGLGVIAGLKPTSRKALSGPALGLLLALVPLLLPIYVVLLFSTHAQPLLVQVTLGAAAVPIYLLVRKAEGASFMSPLQQLNGLLGERLLVAALLIGGLAIVIAFWRVFGRLGGWPSALAVLAALIWLLALGLRVFSYASTKARTLLAAVLGLLILRAFIQAGLAPGEEVLAKVRLLDLNVLFVAALVVLGVVAFLEWWHVRGTETPAMATIEQTRPAGGSTAERAAAAGFTAAVLGGVVLATATFAAAVSAAEKGEEATARPARTVAIPPPASLVDQPQALADMYAPVVALTANERWEPELVDEFVADATIFGAGEDAGAAQPVGTTADLPSSCPPGRTAPCYTLTLGCGDGDHACAKPRPPLSHGLQTRGAIYARVVKPGAQANGARDPFLDPSPFGDALVALIQYWLFYRYDEWVAPTAAGTLTQHHEGDWESVSVGVANDGPLFVAYSGHCGGRWHHWSDVEVVRAVRDGNSWNFNAEAFASHPLVAVAEGSHANYLRSWNGRTPDWLACRPGIPVQVTATSYLWNLREKTSDERRLIPAQVQLVHDRELPIAFPGYWGAGDSIVLTNFRSHAFPVGHSPASPRLKRFWTHPLDIIFCSESWGNKPCENSSAD